MFRISVPGQRLKRWLKLVKTRNGKTTNVQKLLPPPLAIAQLALTALVSYVGSLVK